MNQVIKCKSGVQNLKLFRIQEKHLFFWFNMYFDDYPKSMMMFHNLPEAKAYIKELRRFE